jgi:hypothetical protein
VVLPIVVVVAVDGNFFDGSVHPFDLTVGPGMVGFGEPVIDTVSVTDAVEGLPAEASDGALAVPGQIRELDAIVGEYPVDAVRNSFDQCFPGRRRQSHLGAFHEFDHSELGSSVDGHER